MEFQPLTNRCNVKHGSRVYEYVKRNADGDWVSKSAIELGVQC